jgi:type II secretory pathway pseudopilin PulG
MRRQATCNGRGSSRRGAFTLLELTVVIFIIVTLVALTSGAVIKFMAVQQTSNTRTLLDRTQAKLNTAWSAVKDQAYKDSMSETVPGTNPPVTVSQWIQANLALNTGNLSDPNITGRVRVIYVKLRLRQAFPMNFTEALNPFPLPPIAAYQTNLLKLGINTSTGANFESSACLLMALQRAQSGGGTDVSDLAGGGATGNGPTPNGGSIPFIADAWGQPLFFSRVPVGSIALNSNPFPGPPGPGQPGNNDPLDPQGYLQTAGWASVNGQTTAPAQLFSALTLQKLAGPNNSFNQAPMLFSGGPNKVPDADPITFAPNVPNNLADDLYSTP